MEKSSWVWATFRYEMDILCQIPDIRVWDAALGRLKSHLNAEAKQLASGGASLQVPDIDSQMSFPVVEGGVP